MIYKVMRKKINEPEVLCAEFLDLEDAKLFIKAAVYVGDKTTTYRVYHNNTFLDGLFEASVPTHTVFRPTPFSTTPLPSGYPSEWLVDEKNENEKE